MQPSNQIDDAVWRLGRRAPRVLPLLPSARASILAPTQFALAWSMLKLCPVNTEQIVAETAVW